MQLFYFTNGLDSEEFLLLEICKDEDKANCKIFLGYPQQCLKYKSLTLKKCRRTCRICGERNAKLSKDLEIDGIDGMKIK